MKRPLNPGAAAAAAVHKAKGDATRERYAELVSSPKGKKMSVEQIAHKLKLTSQRVYQIRSELREMGE